MRKTILVLAANPKGTPPLRLDQEIREIDNGLQRARRRDEFVLKQVWAVRPVDVRRAMLDAKPNIVHFCGHGEGEEGIAFEDDMGNVKLVNAEALAEFFDLFADSVECVVLNACYSEVQAEAIAQYIDHVIGMKKGIGDTAAIEFAVAFYDALGAGKPIEFAYKLASNAIQWASVPDHLTPALKIRKKFPAKRPYKFLNYFDTNDADIFFGRESEIDEIFSRVISRRLLVVYGKSGVGKTSLINAGLIPRLPANYLPVVVRCFDDPIEIIRVTVSQISEDCTPAGYRLQDLLAALHQHTGKTPVIILDQFEEFFVRLDEEVRARFVHEMGPCYREKRFDLQFVIVIREDFFAHLSEFKREIPEIFHNEYRLLPLNKVQARAAITQPVALLGIIYDSELVEQLLNDLYRNGIDPPQLQIVCDRLYDAWLRKGGTTIDRELYKSLGGTESILREYFDLVLARFLGSERQLAQRILKALITTYDTKVVSSAIEIGHSLGESTKEVTEVLLELSRARVVRTVEGEVATFELAHECLIPKIRELLSLEEIELKRAEELLRREKETFHQFGRLAPFESLQVIHQQRERLKIGPASIRFLVRSAMQHNFEVDYWLRRAHYDDQELIQQLVDDLETQNLDLQRNACTLLLRMEISDVLIDKILSILSVIGNPKVINRLQALGVSERLIIEAEKAVIRRIMRNMVYVPGEAFIMGSSKGAVEQILSEWDVPRAWIETELPRHRVVIGSFYMDKYLVTNAEYKEFDENYTCPSGREDHPAVSISWHMARASASWFGKRLPTEAEWEKAARGTDGRYYPWGNKFDIKKCNSYEARIRTTAPITKYDREDCRSPYGCCDMAGNVWEWTSTLYRPYPYKEDDGREDPSLEGARVVRGGSFAFYHYVVRTTYRFGAGPIAIDTNQGFRCCISEPPKVGMFSERLT
jgi:formylglycine-generating enzyme required for sulfatase activity